ncbi:MAG: ABC transporter permease [Bacteroidota bacterium]
MIWNYLKISWRTLWKNRLHSLILVFGLSIGMAACLILMSFVGFELSFDRFHEKGENIYRLVNDRYSQGELSQRGTITYPSVGKLMKDEFPEIEMASRMTISGRTQVKIEDELFPVEEILFVDGYFFEMFSFPLLAGNPETVMEEVNQVVITESLAKTYFDVQEGQYQSVLGKSLQIGNDPEMMKVVGVCADFPENSLIQQDFMVSYASFVQGTDGAADNSTTWSDFYHYLVIREGTDIQALEAKFPAFSEKYFETDPAYGNAEAFSLQPLFDAHLYSEDLEYEIGQIGNGTSVWALLIIAALILLMAWINYINLATARSMERAREVGVRKVIGAERRQLLWQFFLEALQINLLALVIGFELANVSSPWLSGLMGTELSFSYIWSVPGLRLYLIGALIASFVIGVLVSGLLPALGLANIRLSEVLKGKLQRSGKGKFTQKSLVVIQFVASIVLIAGTLVVYQQINYMRQQESGLELEQTLVIYGPGATTGDSSFIQKMDAFKNELVRNANIHAATTSGRTPGMRTGRTFNLKRLNGPNADPLSCNFIGVDHNFDEVYGIQSTQGRFLESRDHHPDFNQLKSIVINEAAVKHFGFSNAEEAIQQGISFFGKEWEIVGVFEDFHQQSLHYPIEPLLLAPLYDYDNFISMKIDAAEVSSVLAFVEQTFGAFYPGNVMDYYFADERFARQYEVEQRFGQMLLGFSFLAILIACLGLFGLASYTAYLRTKEIGIRKVLGASTFTLVRLLTTDFMRLVGLAALVGLPLAWYTSQLWLENYAYTITLQWWHFALAGLVAVLIAFLAISFRSIQVAVSNPVEALRNE